MLSGNGQAVHIHIAVDTGKAGIHYSKYGRAWQLPDNIWQENQNCRLLFSKSTHIIHHSLAVVWLLQRSAFASLSEWHTPDYQEKGYSLGCKYHVIIINFVIHYTWKEIMFKGILRDVKAK